MQPESAPPTPFPARFTIERKLGSGGFGVVYQAFDHGRNSRVAIKTLSQLSPAGLYSLKHEFRSLAGLVHPNLATLFELFTSEEQCFLTMELLEGTDFVTAIRPRALPMPALTPPESANDPTVSFTVPIAPVQPTQDWPKLRNAMGQLIKGLAAIHDAGQLHRDIKPSNVLVEPGGRVVILDFGLVASANPSERDADTGGTPRYMAPEHRAGQAVAASDWYSAGVMLYECLTGQRLTGYDVSLLLDPESAVPPDLRETCLRMIARDPAQRPRRDELLRVFCGGDVPETPAPASRGPFVGRAADLEQLEAAMASTASGHAAVARIRGASGIGKSALCREFDRLVRERHPTALIFHTRCHDRESVRYKAVDGIVDEISRFLAGLSSSQADRYLPLDIGPLALVFPVLSRLAAVRDAPRRGRETNDPQELRRRAFVALRELLGRLAVVLPVALFVDDLQWCDLDSVPLLETILREPDSPAILFVAAWRADEEANPALAALLPVLRSAQGCEITLRDLPMDDALALARTLSPSAAAQDVVRQAGGNPFLIDAYLRHALDPKGQPPDIESVIEAQIARLPDAARLLLEWLSLAGRPLPAAMFPGGVELRLHELLLSERLIRIRAGGDLEPYHDRVRDAIAARIPAERRRERHLWLARTLAAQPATEPEAVAQQFHAGGDFAAAARYAEPAADLALRSFAFNRAVALYEMALANPDLAKDHQRALLCRLGDAFTGTGQAYRSAKAYQGAAEIAPPAEQIDLLRLAGERLLVSGYIDEGSEMMARVARLAGIELTRSTRATLLSLLSRRAWLRVRGLGFKPARPEDVAPDLLQRIDVCASLVSGFAAVDPFRAFDFQARTMMYALRAGEPVRVARALAMEVPSIGSSGSRNWARTRQLVNLASELVASTGDPAARHLLATTSAIVSFFAGRWEEALERLGTAAKLDPPEGSGSAWVNSSKVLFGLVCSLYAGEIAAVRERLADALADARGRGDLNAETTLLCRCAAIPKLALDDPEGVRTQVRAAIAKWSQRGYFLHHFWALLAETEAALYSAEVEPAWARLTAEWPALRKAHLFEMQIIAIEALHLRARTAVAMAAMGHGDLGTMLSQARADVRQLEAEQAEWGDGLVLLLRAGIAHVQEQAEAGDMARRAAAALEACGMKIHAAAARRRTGEWNGEAAALAEADAVMRAQGIRDPVRFTAMLAPG